MRLRIFDLNTPWFWLTIFFQRRYAKPWLEVSLWPPNTWKRWWINIWMREEWPTEMGGYATIDKRDISGVK